MRHNNASIDKIVIFTRHKLTDQQTKEIADFAERNNVDPKNIFDATDLASKNIQTTEEAYFLVRELIERTGVGNMAIFGVIPTLVRKTLLELEDDELYDIIVKTYEAHNITRSVEGGKPTFSHAGWYLTGVYHI